MILPRLPRQKIFTGLSDGFGGKKGQIVRNRFLKKQDSYKNWGPWVVEVTDHAKEEIIEDLNDKDVEKVEKILKELETNPYQGSYGQHPLWEFFDKQQECVVWSTIINNEDRLNYLIFKTQNYILVTNAKGHMVIDKPYAIRPVIFK